MQIRDESSQPTGKSPSNLLGVSIGIRRVGSSVQLCLECGADYRAIEVYDSLVESAQRGELRIDLKIK
jgi:hypothetical protein